VGALREAQAPAVDALGQRAKHRAAHHPAGPRVAAAGLVAHAAVEPGAQLDLQGAVPGRARGRHPVADGGHLAAAQRHQPLDDQRHPPARRRAPGERARERAGAQVEAALVRLQLATPGGQPLALDAQLDGLTVADVDQRLAGASQAVRLLGVADGGGLVEAVEVGAPGARAGKRLEPLLEGAAHPQVAVPQREDRLAAAGADGVEARLAHLPRVGRVDGAGVFHGSSRDRIVRVVAAPAILARRRPPGPPAWRGTRPPAR